MTVGGLLSINQGWVVQGTHIQLGTNRGIKKVMVEMWREEGMMKEKKAAVKETPVMIFLVKKRAI